MADTNGNGFTVKEILLRLEQSNNERFDALDAKVDKITGDHESRIRTLEKFRGAFPSVAVLSLVVGIAAIVVAIVQGA